LARLKREMGGGGGERKRKQTKASTYFSASFRQKKRTNYSKNPIKLCMEEEPFPLRFSLVYFNIHMFYIIKLSVIYLIFISLIYFGETLYNLLLIVSLKGQFCLITA
jgi:hypothetical protein